MISVRTGDHSELEAFLAEKIYRHNADATGYDDAESFCASTRGAAGEIAAGISGYTWGGRCYVTYLWVSAQCRGKGIGSHLLRAVESHARAKSCRLVVLRSHTFQAPGFYAQRGYAEIARIDDYPVGHADIVLAKRLS